MILTGSARVAGVMGWPVEHSRSPRLHGFWLEQHGIDGAYVPFSVSPPHFQEAVRALPRLGLRGVNVTLPHKEAALAACTEVDAVAQRIGAVNTIIVRPDGSLLGTNTDAFGFLESLRQGHPGFDPAAGPAIVLGAGGAARAVVAALADCGSPRIRLVNRTRATFRNAELGFFGVDVYTRVQTPRFCGDRFRAGTLLLFLIRRRPRRTS